MHTIYHAANTRGHANHGWLQANHTFSFANYFDPERIHFGVLRVLNDDTIAGGRGFEAHPHNNMEIITIPLSGSLQHQDNLGNRGVIQQGQIQVMSAGTGVIHSEMNADYEEPVSLLQIWVIPHTTNVTPRYEDLTLPPETPNHLEQIVSPNPEDAGSWIHQHAWFHVGSFEAGHTLTYSIKHPGNGVYLFIIQGEAQVGEHRLHTRDGLGISDTSDVTITMNQDTRILLMDIPMELPT